KQRVRLIDLETHLRRAHDIFEYRGVRRTYQETRAFLLRALCSASPDVAAWKTLEAIARDRHGDETERRLANWLAAGVRTVERDKRVPAVAALAEAIVAGKSGVRLLPVLLDGKDAGAQPICAHLALEITARLPPPAPKKLIEMVQPLLADKQAPNE